MINELKDFIKKSTTAFHAVQTIREELEQSGYTEVFEYDVWSLDNNGKYFMTRNDSSIFAFTIPKNFKTLQVCATHLDSPCFKLKHEVINENNSSLQIDVERYGGMLLHTWFDRPLSLAGRAVVGDNHRTVLFDLKDPVLMIPNVAIHLKGGEVKQIDVQKEMMPVIGQGNKFDLLDFIKTSSNIQDDIHGLEAFVYNPQLCTVWGKNKEFFSAPRIDNLECSFATLKAILNSNNENSLNIAAFYDNEEVGSSTKQGANSTVLEDILNRICECFELSKQQYLALIASGFMVSADNAHGHHPNYNELYSKTNAPLINKGVVIKHNANQKYTTDSMSSAIFTTLCKNSDTPVQHFYNNSNVAGGSTLGNIASSHVSLRSVDIGLAQWAMHSSYETAGVQDIESIVNVLSYYYNHYIDTSKDGTIIK